jgi:hypothetical protein
MSAGHAGSTRPAGQAYDRNVDTRPDRHALHSPRPGRPDREPAPERRRGPGIRARGPRRPAQLSGAQLIVKNVINITDLPGEAQAKLFARKSFRERSARNSLRLFSESEFSTLIDDTNFGSIR